MNLKATYILVCKHNGTMPGPINIKLKFIAFKKVILRKLLQFETIPLNVQSMQIT